MELEFWSFEETGKNDQNIYQNDPKMKSRMEKYETRVYLLTFQTVIPTNIIQESGVWGLIQESLCKKRSPMQFDLVFGAVSTILRNTFINQDTLLFI